MKSFLVRAQKSELPEDFVPLIENWINELDQDEHDDGTAILDYLKKHKEMSIEKGNPNQPLYRGIGLGPEMMASFHEKGRIIVEYKKIFSWSKDRDIGVEFQKMNDLSGWFSLLLRAKIPAEQRVIDLTAYDFESEGEVLCLNFPIERKHVEGIRFNYDVIHEINFNKKNKKDVKKYEDLTWNDIPSFLNKGFEIRKRYGHND